MVVSVSTIKTQGKKRVLKKDDRADFGHLWFVMSVVFTYVFSRYTLKIGPIIRVNIIKS